MTIIAATHIPYPWHAAIMLAVSLLFVVWSYRRARTRVRQWAVDNGYELLDTKFRLLFQGPFAPRAAHYGGSVFNVRVRDREGRERAAWVYCPWLWGPVTVQWEDEVSPARRTAGRLIGILGAIALLCGICGWLALVSQRFTGEPEPHGTPADAEFRRESYAAIAYSPKTSRFGYGDNCLSREQAEDVARKHCNEADCRIVVWVRNGFCALAIGDGGADGVGVSDGDRASDADAKEKALAECKKRSGTGRLLICVCSFERRIERFD